jgi:hypothetical protein
MPVQWAFGELEAALTASQVLLSTDTSANGDTSRVTTRSRVSLTLTDSSFAASYIVRNTAEEGWFHCRFKTKTSGSSIAPFLTAPLINIINTQGEHLFGIFAYRNSLSVQCFDASLTFPGGSVNTPPSPLPSGMAQFSTSTFSGQLDVHYNLASTGGFVRFYADGSLVATLTGNSGNTLPASGNGFPNRLVMRSNGSAAAGNSGRVFMTEVIFADEDTINMQLHTMALTQSGTNDWSGTFSEVAGTGVASSGIFTNTLSHRVQFTAAAPSIGAGREINCLIPAFFGRANSAANVKTLSLLRNSVATPLIEQPLLASVQMYQEPLTINPLTGNPWQASEFGGSGVLFELRADT